MEGIENKGGRATEHTSKEQISRPVRRGQTLYDRVFGGVSKVQDSPKNIFVVSPRRVVELPPDCVALKQVLVEAREIPVQNLIPHGPVRKLVTEGIEEIHAYAELKGRLGKETPEIPEAFMLETLERVLATEEGLEPLESIPIKLQRAVGREIKDIADRAHLSPRNAYVAEDVALSLRFPDRPRSEVKRTPAEDTAWAQDVNEHVAPYLKEVAMGRPVRVDDTPGWDLMASLVTMGLVGAGEAGIAATATVLDASEATSWAGKVLDPAGAIYEEFKEFGKKIAHKRLDEKATAADRCLQHWHPET
ncbi:hypothetical protein [Streptacidiphilus sp. EB103A]|uniref:hypothetical protein n=1 Tax=Streptacidiphilus sp. EB103A TaxID=3156275 RepID=UPI003511BCF8